MWMLSPTDDQRSDTRSALASSIAQTADLGVGNQRCQAPCDLTQVAHSPPPFSANIALFAFKCSYNILYLRSPTPLDTYNNQPDDGNSTNKVEEGAPYFGADTN